MTTKSKGITLPDYSGAQFSAATLKAGATGPYNSEYVLSGTGIAPNYSTGNSTTGVFNFTLSTQIGVNTNPTVGGKVNIITGAGATGFAAGTVVLTDTAGTGGLWNGNHLVLGASHVWMGSDGSLRFKTSAPTTDLDGTSAGAGITFPTNTRAIANSYFEVANASGYTGNNSTRYRFDGVSPSNATETTGTGTASSYYIQTQAASNVTNPNGGTLNLLTGAGFGGSGKAGNVVIQDTGSTGGAWNGAHLLLGANHIWFDGTGALRFKSTAPTSSTDGTSAIYTPPNNTRAVANTCFEVANSGGYTGNFSYKYGYQTIAPSNTTEVTGSSFAVDYTISTQNASNVTFPTGSDIILKTGSGFGGGNAGNIYIQDNSGTGGAWNGAHLRFQLGNIWIDANNVVRFKQALPTFDTDGAPISVFKVATAVFDPPSLATLTSTTTDITVTGAVVGDMVRASFSLALGSIMLSAHVNTANTVRVVFFNAGAGTVDLASGTVTVHVSRQ